MSGPISKEDWVRVRRESVANLDDVIAATGRAGVLLPYQGSTVAELESGTALLVIEKSRRVGLTWGLASYAVLRAARAKPAGGMDAMYISYSQEMTREFIDACAMWARAYSIAAAEAEEFLFDDISLDDPEDTKKIQAFRIRFASGFEILALSSAPRGLRGKQGLVIIDEAAFVDSLKELLKAALAFLMWGGQVVVCSTHNGVDNEFNVLVQDILGERRKGAHKKIDFDQALLDGLYQRICLVTGREWSPEAEAQWRQDIIDFYAEGADEELFCIPAQGSGAWLTAPLIEARMTLLPEDAPIIRIQLPENFLFLDPLQRAQLFEPQLDEVKRAVDRCRENELHAAGYDPARKRDPAVLTLLAIEKLLRRRSALTVEMRNVPFDEQKRIARVVFHAPRMIGAAIDATGMGMNLAEDLGREFGLRQDEEGPGLVWAISLNPGWYNTHFPPLRTAFEDDAIALAKDAEHLGDLRLVKVVRGIPQVPAEREGTVGNKRHGDFAVGLGLAHFASRQQWHEYGYTAVSTGVQRDGNRSFDTPPEELFDAAVRDPYRAPLGARIRGGF
ncbi:terminase large subunit domain-containing protein [Nitratireductor soli]|uniref:terminase large subunit domain-containing protein n=1 Tax=Nitratireductor soli TaxID=1670619 RepID=UPI00065E4689|nr:terminase family protein [Nitratireductor soli]